MEKSRERKKREWGKNTDITFNLKCIVYSGKERLNWGDYVEQCFIDPEIHMITNGIMGGNAVQGTTIHIFQI